MDNSERLSLFQSDMSSAFYLFKVPRAWLGHLAFNVVMDGADIGRLSNIKLALVCSVIPMGWLSSVSVIQEIFESLLRNGGLNLATQIMRGKPLPIWMNEILSRAKNTDKTWWHVYLDNFFAGERLLPHDQAFLG